VRLLHEFYLTTQDGTPIFSKALPADRTSFLTDFFRSDLRNINSDINCTIPDATCSFFRDHKLKIVPAYSGFKVAVEVIHTTDGAFTAFKPLVPLPKDNAITVFVERTNRDIDIYTNLRMKNTIKGIFYLSNDNSGTAKTFPFLTNPVPAKDVTYPYEQGELSAEAGVIKSFYLDNTLSKQWLPVSAGTNFINETDRLAVAPFFDYSFDPSDNVTTATFDLKDSANTQVYKNIFTSSNPLQTVSVRIDPAEIKKVPNGTATDKLLHNLTVTGNGGYKKTFRLIFFDSPVQDQPWAIININPSPADPAYQIIDNKGLLITRLNADGTVAVAPPVFEIWMKSRFTFWRYISNEGDILKNLFPAVLTPSGNNLVTQVPRNNTYLPVPVGAQRLPNPEPFSMIKKEGVRNFSDIIVPISNSFPKGP
jgi:hypothetical protein